MPGAGKTHYAIALGISACLAGKSVLFASVPNLVVELKEAISNFQIVLDISREKGGRYEETAAWLENNKNKSSKPVCKKQA